MWIIFLFAFIEYITISTFLPIDAYASKARKRLKRFVKLLIWLLTGFVANYVIKEDGDYIIYLMISAFFVVKYLVEIINPYLGSMFCLAVVYSLIGYFLWFFWYQNHPIIIGILILFLVYATLSCWKEEFLKIRQGLDADIEEEQRRAEEMEKEERRKSLFKLARIAFKIWRI